MLLAWISLSVEITVYAAELNVVLARRLWPRSIVQPPLTEADRAVLAAQALQNQRRDEQRVHVSYEDTPPRAAAGFPRTPDEITPSAPSNRDGKVANTRPATGQARARLKEHMPELVPTWERLTTMIPGSRDAGAALALWNPPPFLTGCSQAAVLDGGPALIRNYDWDYRLFDGVVAKTAYTGRRVLGMVDCLWGLLDGVNDAGLAVSLTFGGRPQVGEGFGIPLVIRYVLEVCGTVDEAVQVLRRVPVHMSYNVTVLDRCGQWATVYVAPDRPPRVTDRAVATNHQGSVEWAPYATAIRSVEREQRLEELLAHGVGVADLIEACLRPPLYATRFHHGFGTLYTAEYRPADGIVRYHWPQRRWEQSLDNIKTDSIQLQLGTP